MKRVAEVRSRPKKVQLLFKCWAVKKTVNSLTIWAASSIQTAVWAYYGLNTLGFFYTVTAHKCKCCSLAAAPSVDKTNAIFAYLEVR
jgi:hypothetical protein